LRILTVSAFFESHSGGIEIVAGALARALARLGYDSRWAAAAFDAPPQDESVAAIPLPATDPIEKLLGLPMPLLHRKARALLEQEIAAADAVIVHDALYASSLKAVQLARRHGKPWVLIQHIGEIPYSNPLLRGALALANALVTRPMLKRAPQVVFISDIVRRYFASVDYRRAPELRFNGVDSALFHPAKAGEVAGLRAELGLHVERPQLLFVGRFVEKKGLAVLREFAALRPDCDLWMIGGGPIDPRTWRCANVHVLGRKSRQEIARLYQACDALVLPSAGEGYPLVIQEAMASGLAVFCGSESAEADPGASRFLTGIEVDLADPAETARRLAAAVGNGINSRNAVAAAYAREHYDWDANARWFAARFEELAEAS
jgi:glycosyltransferase involved in cell wall biosynthesis